MCLQHCVLQEAIFHRYTLVRSIDRAWGSQQNDGTFDGIVGMLQRSEVDYGVTAFGLSKGRAEAADFLLPLGGLK